MVKTSQLILIPVSVIGGKTRLLRPHTSHSLGLEISIAILSGNFETTFALVESLHANRKDKDKLSLLIKNSTSLQTTPTSFDLTSLASHREVLLLSEPLRVLRIKKMIEITGLIQVSKENVYFQSIPNFSFRKLKRFSLSKGFTVNLIKYKLKDTGVELQFSKHDTDTKSKNLFILFNSSYDRDQFVTTLQKIDGVSSDSISSTVSLSPPIPPLHIVTDLWRNCYISNFSYLMYLNFMAGRSVNDIGQYPVLPWTLSNMESETMNFNDPKNYRDLSVPIAATNRGKLDQAIERSSHMSPEERFLFGSFYSNPAFVLYFLIRKFPECHLRLHGGHFDHSARLFSSLKISWEAVSKTGSAMMELIPEFYSDWNHAKDWLKTTTPSNEVADVILPPWISSHADPSEFVILMRCALESSIVSAHLHEWIDLVFGVKSRGKQICLDSNNLFHPICYLTDLDGDVIRYCKDNDTTSDVVVLQSQEFGHVPKQLFVTDPHPVRIESRWMPERSDPAYYRQMGNNEINWRDEIFAAIDKLGKRPVVPEIEGRPDPQPPPATVVTPPTQPKMMKNFATIETFSTTFSDEKENFGDITDFVNIYGEMIAVTNRGYFLSSTKRFRLSSKPLLSIVATIKKSLYLVGGAEGDVFIVSSVNGRIVQKRIHDNSVTVIDVVGTFGVSGSTDQSIAIWDLDTLNIMNQLDFHSSRITCIHVLDDKRFMSGDSTGHFACWDLSRPSSPLVWSSSIGKSRSIASIASVGGRTVAIFDDASNSVLIVDVNERVTLWDHAMGAEKILGGFFPSRNDSSILFLVTNDFEGGSSSVVSVHLTFKTITSVTNFVVNGKSQISNEPVVVCRKIMADNSLSVISKKSATRTVSVIKKKMYYNFDAFCIHIAIVS